MKITQYTSLPISRLIHDKVPEVETGAWSQEELNGEGVMLGKKPNTADWMTYDAFPRYTLHDVLYAIKVLMQDEEEDECFDLLGAYLSDGLQFGEKSEKVIRNIFEL